MIISSPKNEEVIRRMLERTTYDPINCCLLYHGGQIQNGHCQIRVNGILKLVHRISASIYLGFDLDSKIEQVNHKPECPNPNCWDYNHLYIGTQADNVHDTLTLKTHGNIVKTHCPKGHEYTEENTYITRKDFRMCRICKNESSRNAKSRGK